MDWAFNTYSKLSEPDFCENAGAVAKVYEEVRCSL